MLTIAQCLSRSQELNQVSDSARLDTEILLAKAIDKPRAFLYTWSEKELDDVQQQKFLAWFEQRLCGKPIAFIVGEKEFWSLTLKVNSSTLIPRPETELLVETILELLPESKQQVLDLGTGTGAIALALAKERSSWDLLAVDNSRAAVELAIDNCRSLGLTNVQINKSDWFKNVNAHNFDAIVCNPPYIANDDPHLQRGDVQFEPSTALVADDNGLADIKLIVGQANNYLKPGGVLALEHGWQQGEGVRKLFKECDYLDVETREDLAGNDRVTLGWYQKKN